MDAILERCCGIDVHKKRLTACLLTGTLSRKPKVTVKTFSTMTCDLLRLKDWLEREGCTHVAIESTGVYWKPVFNIIEGSLTVVLANARDIKNVPGRKTDVRDCQWIAQLLRCGLVKASFIPPKPIRELRDLTRYRKKLIGHLSSEKNRIHKVLEDANIKLSSVATDIFGVSGKLMINALLDGNSDAKEMADMAKGCLRNKIKELEKALVGSVSDHHRFMVRQSLDHIRYLNGAITDMDERIDDCMEPYRDALERLDEIPGVKKKRRKQSSLKSASICQYFLPMDICHPGLGCLQATMRVQANGEAVEPLMGTNGYVPPSLNQPGQLQEKRELILNPDIIVWRRDAARNVQPSP